ncbi:MAG: glutamyl-tRNA reductase [Chromatiales bacterium]|nr:glutamyl-tRNA reductase [Chromatiales bacterium]
MNFTVVGLDHLTAPFALRERLSLTEEAIPHTLSDLEKQLRIKHGVVLSTCNRCEIYTQTKSAEQMQQLSKWLCSLGDIDYADNAEYFFQLDGSDAVRHLFSVASGLKSEIIGEPQILGQVKTAYRIALANKRSDAELNKLFEHALYTAKRVRSETALGQYKTSYASVAIAVAQKIFAALSTRQALMIGSGDMIKAAAIQLKNRNIGSLTIAGRSPQNTQRLASEMDANTLSLDKLAPSLHHFDLIISCTASKRTILARSAVEQALKARKQNTICIIDLALPRDIQSSVGELENVYLYNLDNLSRIIDINKNHRLDTVTEAQTIIATEIEHFIRWCNTRQAAHLIARLKTDTDEQADEVYRKSLELISQGKEPTHALEYLKHTLSAKLMHRTIEMLNRAAEYGDADLIETVSQLYSNDEDKK